ncbi:MAG: PA2169 family four-helix-bundle protein [Bacteroidia bacterium]|nr:PA2169 family four-helix-bundle protein [Bacteroidota bacterium]MBP9081826.1 PA2169 family four-helix-bundle protein [Bacteroidia bacterium]MBK7971156.1 PA2169 family four-helix-bundle protein [Bacteroidota bacterium]MBK8415526.1 PA2169 family four-helix-bundle protein [Bacteroidota bacterium]MBK8872533.1 PA2169 family four-helix-bundle protein [Bacteroidota bacterium]
MDTSKNEIQAINSLIEINNDRIQGYKTAEEETEHADLKSIFGSNLRQSQQFNSELGQRVRLLGGEPTEGTTLSGKAYRAWMDVKAALSGKDRKAILNSCEFGEDAALSVYRTVSEGNDLSADSRKIVHKQLADLQKAHDQMKTLRDQQVA